MKRSLINPTEELYVRQQCQLLEIMRGSIHYTPKGKRKENLAMMRMMDEHILEEPITGVHFP